MQQKLVYFRIQNKNMSLKGTLIMGLILFCLRLVLCISCLVIHTFVTSDYNWTIPLWVWAIIFGIGVLSDIVLIYGATKKDITGCSMEPQESYIKYIPEKGEYKKDTKWELFTDGSNLLDVLLHPDVDPYNTTSNNIWEIYRIFGIEAARKASFSK